MKTIEKIRQKIEELYDGEAPAHDQQCEFEDGYFTGIAVISNFLDTLESEKPINPEAAMKELDEKIALVKQNGTWDGIDVDKYMDEVRGIDPEKPMEGLDEEIDRLWESFADEMEGPHNLFDIYARLARHFAEWGAEH